MIKQYRVMYALALAICTPITSWAAEQVGGLTKLTEAQEEFTPAKVEKGRVMYKQLCLRCHGPEMVAGNNAFDLRAFPLDQRDRFFNSVLNGKRAMPPWKDILADEEIGLLWAYVGTRGGAIQR